MLKRAVCTILVSIMMLFLASASYALTVGPARLEIRLPPGEVADIDYYAQNDTESPIRVTVEPENWGSYSHTYKNTPVDSWIKTDVKEFDLKPKEIKKIKVTVRTPKNIKGEVAAQIYFSSAAPEEGSVLSSGVRARLGTVLYVAIRGTEKPEIRITDLQVSGSKVSIVAANFGNVHILPASIEIIIKDRKGVVLKKMPVALVKNILPGQTADYSESIDNLELKPGKYDMSVVIKYGKMYVREKTAMIKKTLLVGEDKEMSLK